MAERMRVEEGMKRAESAVPMSTKVLTTDSALDTRDMVIPTK